MCSGKEELLRTLKQQNWKDRRKETDGGKQKSIDVEILFKKKLIKTAFDENEIKV